MTITFVTAFLNMKKERELYRSVETYISHFQNLVESNIQLHVYFSPDYYEVFKDRFSSDKVFVESIRLEDLRAHKEVVNIDCSLPTVRNTDKDTFNYITCMNSKTEFVKRSIHNNVFNSTHFAWVDFGVFHMINDIENTKKRLHTLANTKLRSNLMVVPTIYQRSPIINFSRVNWRFSGSFFFGDRESLLHFDNLYEHNFLKIIKQYRILTWEVNVWEWFEMFLNWIPISYYGSHDDTMFSNIPFDKI
jgi:hypothetical protein